MFRSTRKEDEDCFSLNETNRSTFVPRVFPTAALFKQDECLLSPTIPALLLNEILYIYNLCAHLHKGLSLVKSKCVLHCARLPLVKVYKTYQAKCFITPRAREINKDFREICFSNASFKGFYKSVNLKSNKELNQQNIILLPNAVLDIQNSCVILESYFRSHSSPF